jgi:carbon-monoxide dehydrogenase medium subunit
MLPPFALYRPETVDEALAALGAHPGEVALYAGGTELLLLLKERLARADTLVDLKRIPALGAITAGDGALTIGATVTHRAVERSSLVQARCPLVAAAARHVANVRVRSVGTVGGNLAFADPHSDLATLFLVFEASVALASPGGTRELPLEAFILGPWETARRDDEILVSVRLRAWPARTVGTYVKFGIHERPTLGVAVALGLGPGGSGVREARLAVGCVGPRPRRLREAEALATGRSLDELLALGADIAALAAREAEPVADLHGSAEWKHEVTRVVVRRALGAAAARAAGREPHERHPHTIVA